MIGLGMRIENIEEFNRRALPALRGLQNTSGFVDAMIRKLHLHVTLTKPEQTALYNVIRDRQTEVTDTLVRDYAIARLRDAD